MIPTEKENPNGLHRRYAVSKTSGEPVDERAEYFILRLDEYGDDPIHIAACRKAVIAYAAEIREHLPDLSKDLYDRYSSGHSIDYIINFYLNNWMVGTIHSVKIEKCHRMNQNHFK